MGAAMLALHRSTGERKWLVMAMAAGNFIAANFIDPRTGGFVASASPDARHLPKPIKQREDNVTDDALLHPARLLFRRGALSRDRRGRHGLSRLAGGARQREPSCPTCCWPRRSCATSRCTSPSSAPRAIRAAPGSTPPRSAYPLAYKRAEWWDKREGKLTNPDVDYPDFPEGPAAFACTRTFCSLPVTDAAAIPAQIDRLQRSLQK
jgi:uncharacterized protein YyaL (SSP411 family)